MLAHSFDPVETKRMQHGTRTFHDTKHSDCACEPEVEDRNHEDSALNTRVAECILHSHVPQDNGETLMGKGKSPETKVGRRMGDAVETEF
jgi:hypothetical protein